MWKAYMIPRGISCEGTKGGMVRVRYLGTSGGIDVVDASSALFRSTVVEDWSVRDRDAKDSLPSERAENLEERSSALQIRMVRGFH